MGAEVIAAVGAGIAAIGSIGSSYLQSRSQDKAAQAQKEAARRNAELAKRQATNEEMMNNRQIAAQQNVNPEAIMEDVERDPFGQLTGGTGISSDRLNLGTAATLGQQASLNTNSSLGTRSQLGSTGSSDNLLLL